MVEYCACVTQIEWRRDGVTIEQQLERHQVNTSSDANMYVTTLTIDNVTTADAGKFTFMAKNDLGEVNVTVSLVVKGTLWLLKFWCWYSGHVSPSLSIHVPRCV